MHLDTGKIYFTLFGSKANHELCIPELVSVDTGNIPRQSPK